MGQFHANDLRKYRKGEDEKGRMENRGIAVKGHSVAGSVGEVSTDRNFNDAGRMLPTRDFRYRLSRRDPMRRRQGRR